MVSAWIRHIKSVQKARGITYKEAMKEAASSYKRSPETKAKRHKKKRHTKKHRRSRHHKKRHHGRRRRHKGGEHNSPEFTPASGAEGASAGPPGPKEIGGSAPSGAPCPLPRDSGSKTQADLLACSGASGKACGPAGGGKRRSKKRRHKRKRKTRRKTRRKRKRRRR